MPRDNDKNNDSSRGRRDGPPKGRSGKPRGPEKKFAKRGFAGKRDGDRRPPAGKREDRPPRREDRAAARLSRDDRPHRGPRKDFRPRDERGEKRPYTPREGSEKRPYTPREGGDKRPYTAREER